MSEQKPAYRVLQSQGNNATLKAKQIPAPLDLPQLERMLIPLLNQVRKAQGKKPVIVPKG